MTRRACVECHIKLPKGNIGNLCSECLDKRESNKYHRKRVEDEKLIGRTFDYDRKQVPLAWE